MTEVLLGQSYHLRFDPKLWAAMQPYPPLGTLYAASYLRERGHSVGLHDSMLAESEAAWSDALEAARPRIAVIYEDNFNYLSKMCLLRMRQAAFTMIAMARERGCTVIVAGSDATDHTEQYLAEGAHFVLVGEGEETLGELMDRLTSRSDMPFEAIAGLAFRENRHTRPFGAGDLPWRINAPRPMIRDLDELPHPAWDLVDLDRYRQIWRERHGYFSLNMVTTRGCPYHCNWCAKPIWGQRYNVRSPEDVVAEMKQLAETYEPDHIWFMDDIMGLKPGWLERFAEELEAHGVRLPFKSLHRVDLLLKGDAIQALQRAGARTVWVGAESGAQKILDAMEKGTRVEQIHATTQRLHEAGIEVGFFLQFGYPGETRADIEKTLQLVRDCQPDDIGISVSYPLPGTPFHERVRDQLGPRHNWEDSSDLAMLYHGPFSTQFYRRLHSVVHREFRVRKAWTELVRRIGKRGSQDSPERPATIFQLLRTLAVNLTALPFARLALQIAALQKQPRLEPIAPRLTNEAAARPTPQAD